jgi:hypothetical protein
MRTGTLVIAATMLCTAAIAPAGAQTAAQPDAQQRIAAIRQSMAQNQAQLKQYSWVETTEVSLKGEVKKREQKECRYGPDGKVQKTPIGDAGEEKGGKRRGIKGRIVEKKVDELKDYMERVGSLVRRYVPPDPQAMQAAVKAGKASADKASDSLEFNDYAKPGDKVTLSFDPAAKKLRAFDVATYLDNAQDQVTLSARFSSLADGTNFLEETLLDAKSKQIQIKTTNFNHKKAAQ